MHTDCTNARVSRQNAYVFICAAPDGPALYYAREVKGHASVAGTRIEDYPGILIHDHEKTFLQVRLCTLGMSGTCIALSERQHRRKNSWL